jgi:dTDP-4-dehydrorhamnose reductase
MNILYIGASGTLGNKLVPLLQALGDVRTPSHENVNITKLEDIVVYSMRHKNKFDLVILSAGYKNQKDIEDHGLKGLEDNIMGASNIVLYCMEHDIPLVYLSTGYIYKGNKRYHTEEDGLLPCNRYAWSKLGGECAVRMMSDDKYLIVRCEFSVVPWHTNYAFTDQFTSREEVSIIANKIYNLIYSDARGTFNVGGKRKSVWQYAKSIADKKIFKCKVKDYATVPLPKDSSLNTSKYRRFIHDKTT